jgi:hypothetical protein
MTQTARTGQHARTRALVWAPRTVVDVRRAGGRGRGRGRVGARRKRVEAS